MDNWRATLEAALAPYGLRLRGGWAATPHDRLPALPRGQTASSVWMVGQAGSECWNAFSSSSFYGDGLPDPMDRWSKSIGDALAAELHGVAIYPSDGPPYHPFQQWAQRAEPVRQSPLMLQIHPEFGLWHAYRFALLLPARLPAEVHPDPGAGADLCLQCDGQPCLNACPVGAFTGTAYVVDRCAEHLHRPDGSACMQTGCQARHACPVGTAFCYNPAHATFHMAAFAASHG